MKAIVQNSYGPPDALQLKDVEKPTPTDGEVLVRVLAASANALDWRPFTMPPLLIRLFGGGLSKPKDTSLGVDLAGRVEAVGKNVTRFKPNDEVFGTKHGSFAEYVCAGENALALKPPNVTFEQAAAVPLAAVTALQSLRDAGHIQSGQKVLIYGAGGGVGTFAVQIAKSFGAKVTAVCSTLNLQVTRSIGADHVIDYTKEDFTQNGQRYDLIIAANGYRPILHYWRALSPGGTCVVVGGSFAQIIQVMLLGSLLSGIGSKKLKFTVARANQKDLVVLKELLQAGKIVPVIDRCYPLSETSQAIRYLVEGHPRGKVVITLPPA